MFIDTTMTPRVDELLKGMIVQSGNDASVALAEGVAARSMLRHDDEPPGPGLGPEEHAVPQRHRLERSRPLQQSARDVARSSPRSIITDFPDFYPLYSVRKFTYNKIKQDNRNLLLGRDPTRRRHEDRLHRRRRLLPGGQRGA
jgi:serine-type D-Ala-D-Ala carboxypeptidase (penicillin-binding protein 5/6)